MKLLKTLRERNRTIIIVWGVFALLLLIMGGVIFNEEDPLPQAIEHTDRQTLERGDFLSVSSFIPLTDFAYEQVDDVEYTYFLVAFTDVYDEVFLAGLRVRPEDAEEIWTRYNATEDAVWIADLPFYGKWVNLPLEASDYFDEGLQLAGYDGTMPVLRMVLEANAGTYVQDTTSSKVAGSVLMVGGFFMGLYAVMIAIGVTQRQAIQTARRLAISESAQQWFNDFEQTATYLSGTYVNRDAILYDNNGMTRLIPARDVVWAYGHQKKHKLYVVIPISTTYQVVLRTSDKKSYAIQCKSKDQANVIFEGLQSLLPHVILGYAPNLEKIYQRNAAGFIESVNALAE